MQPRHISLAIALGLAASASAFATPIVLTNTRPVTVNNAPSGEASLQDILTGGPSFPQPGVFQGSTVNAQTGQSTAAKFSLAANPGTTIPTFVAEYTANAALQSFGIWFGTDSSSLWKKDLFIGAATMGSFAGVSVGNGTLEVIGSQNPASTATCGEEINCGFWNNALINPASFGFYFKVSANGPTYYTADSLNTDARKDRVLAYQNGTTTNWAFAYEDGTDFDYNDMVVKVESIAAAVPEPSSIALLLAGLGLLGFAARRRTST
ncbi:MAG: DUF4114 domain-containing protein [Rhizobacter sp.]